MDEAAAMLLYVVISGLLAESHVFYQQIHSCLAVALGFVSEKNAAVKYPALHAWSAAMGFSFGEACLHMISGIGKHGGGRHRQQSSREYFDTHNFYTLSVRSQRERKGDAALSSRMYISDILNYLAACCSRPGMEVKVGTSSLAFPTALLLTEWHSRHYSSLPIRCTVS
jgi:hypothetical protein